MGENLDRWRYYMKDCSSPDSYIDWGFYYIVGAFLQRRVWLGAEQAALYPNPYIVLVGDPGVGKGRVIKPVTQVIKTFHYKPGKQVDNSGGITVSPEMLNSCFNDDDNVKQIKDKKYLIEIAPNAITYEALADYLAKSIRFISYKKQVDGKAVNDFYSHSSLCFSLDEISSLLRKNTESVVNFLLELYDCQDYKYETKRSGCANIKRGCLSLLAGTTPHFMQTVFGDELITEGFASRTFFIYEYANRFNSLFIPSFSDEQVKGYNELLKHLRKLADLFGEVKLSPDAFAFLDNWWRNIHPTTRPNNSIKLSYYYARKNMHVMKLAMILHFADRLDGEISLDEAQRALKILEDIEKKMHFAIGFDTKNPLAMPAKGIMKYIEKVKEATFKDIWIEFSDEVRESELREIIQFLVGTDKITYNSERSSWSVKEKGK